MSGLGGPRQQNPISISDVLDLKRFCSLFFFPPPPSMFHYNYWCEIEFAEGEIILDLITDAICTAGSIGASFCP